MTMMIEYFQAGFANGVPGAINLCGHRHFTMECAKRCYRESVARWHLLVPETPTVFKTVATPINREDER